MKTKLLTTIFALSSALCALSQVPQGFNYQAIARDGTGNILQNTELQVMLYIQSASTGGTILWKELHNPVTTNSLGLFSLVLGTGARQTGSAAATFDQIDWKVSPKYLKTEIFYSGSWKDMGEAVQLNSVPYALVARNLMGASKLDIKGITSDMEAPLFEVKNKDGQTIFAVYSEGVRIWVADGAKGSRGGFAVGGFDMTKGTQKEYFVVSDDSIRIYIDSNPATKAAGGGFAVSGYDIAKGLMKDYLTIDPDSTNVFVRKINEETVSTFNIIGVDQEGDRQYLLIADPDTLSLAGVLQIQYNILISTAEINTITRTTAFSGGNIVSDGDATVIARGVCWGTEPNPTVYDDKTEDGEGIGTFSSSITGLEPGTTYHVRAYATSYQGTAYGADVSFITAAAPVVPVLTTTSVFPVETTTAMSGGNIISDGEAEISAKGVCWSTTANPTTSNQKTDEGTGSGSFVSNITGLIPATTYHVRAYATNSAGTAYGTDLSFTTPVCIKVFTIPVSSVNTTSASAGGNSISNCGAAINARGVCWGTSPNPTISGNFTANGTGTGSFTSSITGLTKSTVYYIRAYVTTDLGTYYGNEFSFVTLSTITDIDGNVYAVVPIGTQFWMQENLKTENLNDGTPIPDITDAVVWENTKTPALCYYNNDKAANKNIYGALYNWYSVSSGKLCPEGWHVPTSDEWTILFDFVGGSDIAGYKLKEAGTSHWQDPNYASDEYVFKALPGGYQYTSTGHWYVYGLGSNAYWGTTTLNSETTIIASNVVNQYYYGQYPIISITSGLSVRCVKN
jgi:uncharacterized protein (TIGR02145 family)